MTCNLTLGTRTEFEFLEEMKAGNFERECIEENCDVEELAEVFDNTDVSEPIQLKYDKCSKIVTAGKTGKFD